MLLLFTALFIFVIFYLTESASALPLPPSMVALAVTHPGRLRPGGKVSLPLSSPPWEKFTILACLLSIENRKFYTTAAILR